MKRRKLILKNKKIVISLIGLIFLLFLIMQINGYMNSTRIIRAQKQEEKKAELFSYIVYDNKDENNIKVLITVNSESGIDYVECPNGNNINGNGKKKLGIDYEIKKDESYKFKIKEIKKEELQEKELKVDDKAIEDTTMKINIVTDVDGYSAFTIEKKFDLEGYQYYYKIGKNSIWEEGDKFYFFDYDLKQNNLIEEGNTITISAKLVNNSNENEVSITTVIKQINASEIEKNIEAESLIKAISSDNLQTGKYTIKINNEIYNTKIYNIIGNNPNIITNTSIGVSEDVGTEDRDAQNMIILKINGNLTIDKGGTIIPYASLYGGPKGMFIYCTGTLTNNGTISMTGRGAKAEGQDVYLWKNTDGSYEYVPAIGAERR